MNDIRKYIDILETASQDELQKYRDELKYWQNQIKKYWPVSKELMAQYKDGSHSEKDSDGDTHWFQNDKLHRDGDKPAIIDASGRLFWYQNGKRHRDGDKPAFIGASSSLAWYQNDQNHRDGDKPAKISAGGRLEWLQNDLYHRFRGPARIWPNLTCEWWWRGEYISVNSQEEFIEYLKKHKGLQQFRVNK